jgi:plastocyanin domain-containing protein
MIVKWVVTILGACLILWVNWYFLAKKKTKSDKTD